MENWSRIFTVIFKEENSEPPDKMCIMCVREMYIMCGWGNYPAKPSPDNNISGPNVCPTMVLSSRRWANVSPTYIAVWEGLLRLRFSIFPKNLPYEAGHPQYFVLYSLICIQHKHYSPDKASGLTHWGRDKMADIFQTTFSNAFSWMKILEFRLKFHWSLVLIDQLTIFQHWFR